MRPQQQNRRMRGRNNNNGSNANNNGGNRKGNQNPLSRSYESNGPDVKIRGNAQQIADKYTTLARDAQSSGDRVMAENYLQHAEHYNRIIAAAQASMPIQNFQNNRDEFDDEEFDEREDGEGSDQPQVNGQAELQGNGPQPVIDGVPAEVALNGEGNGEQQPRARSDRRDDRRDNNFRNRDRRNNNRNGEGRNGDYRNRDAQASEGSDAAEADVLPAFVTNATPQPAFEPAPQIEASDEVAVERPRRGRRPRRTEGDAVEDGQAIVTETPANPVYAEE